MNRLHELMENYIKEKQESKKKPYSPLEWLDNAAKRASQLYVGTHMLKYTHGDVKGVRGLCAPATISDKVYLSTGAITDAATDFEGNAASLDVAKFLLIEVEGRTVLDSIKQQDCAVFSGFSNDAEQRKGWVEGFRAVLQMSKPTCHTLAKQVYFPVSQDEYHLACPVFSSSLQQEIYKRVHAARFSEEQKIARQKKREGKSSDVKVVFYPNLAMQTFGGSKPQNISFLNSMRGGRAYLLSCQPPKWKVPDTKTFKGKQSFKRYVFYKLKAQINDLKRFMSDVAAAPNNKPIREAIDNQVDAIVDRFFSEVERVRHQLPGWSAESGIPMHEKLCLDPLFDNEEFQALRAKELWRESIADSFAMELKRKLSPNKGNLEDAHYNQFYKKCLFALKELS